ncbi:MAG: carbohydrate kinase family protein [Cyanobacteria bacterium HKST-UBA04]|nr:carbohydrate kinase family protein [Cyanobacteria bacterium HKST-UBA04]
MKQASCTPASACPLDIVCIGSALEDIFINVPVHDDATAFIRSNHLSISLGAKINVDYPLIEVGGGGTNTAMNFSIQGLKVGLLSKIANDDGGHLIRNRLEDARIDLRYLQVDTDSAAHTGMSIILNVPQHDRSVLVNRGVSHGIDFDTVDWDQFKTVPWLYVASYGSPNEDDFERLAALARDHDVKIAFNPSINQIKRGLKVIGPLIEASVIVSMNRTEATLLTKSKKNERVTVLLDKMRDLCPGLTLITCGASGVFAADANNRRYYIPPMKVNATSTLGAGDAFCSTFTASIIKDGWDVPLALKRANVSAAHVIQEPGAQRGLLPIDDLDAELKTLNLSVDVLDKEMTPQPTP